VVGLVLVVVNKVLSTLNRNDELFPFVHTYYTILLTQYSDKKVTLIPTTVKLENLVGYC
jgi:hypothetical protein